MIKKKKPTQFEKKKPTHKDSFFLLKLTYNFKKLKYDFILFQFSTEDRLNTLRVNP